MNPGKDDVEPIIPARASNDDTNTALTVLEDEQPLRRSRSFFSEIHSVDSSNPPTTTHSGGPIMLASDPDEDNDKDASADARSICPSECFPFLDEIVKRKENTAGELALMVQGVYKTYNACLSVSNGNVLNGFDLKKCYLNQMLVIWMIHKSMLVKINIYLFLATCCTVQ